MILIALSGDRSYNGSNQKKYVISGNSISRSSTVHFDELVKDKILHPLIESVE